MTGTWSGTCTFYGNTYAVDGTFSITIDPLCVVSGSYNGSDFGSISGGLDASGNYFAHGGVSGGYTWSGHMSLGGGSDLSGNGTWSGSNFNCSGGWYGAGPVF
jgi:hypothetical protein